MITQSHGPPQSRVHPGRLRIAATPTKFEEPFFGNESLPSQELSREFDDFSSFLTLCIEDPAAAAERMSQVGLDRRSGADIVARYSKEVRRLYMDLRQERESRLLAIRHSLESELLDAAIDQQPSSAEVNDLLEAFVPDPAGLAPGHLLAPMRPASPAVPVTVNINQQFINAVESNVVQNVQGTVHLGSQAKELLDPVGRFGGRETGALESAVHELEDPDARSADRLSARQRLKGFLLRLGAHVEGAALAALQKYLETKMGV